MAHCMGACAMKEVIACLMMITMMALTLLLMELEDQTKLTKEQVEILTIYCKSMPECREEMEK